MKRINLTDYLEEHKHFRMGMKVSSDLLDNMVVRGFVNSSKDMIDDSRINIIAVPLKRVKSSLK